MARPGLHTLVQVFIFAPGLIRSWVQARGGGQRSPNHVTHTHTHRCDRGAQPRAHATAQESTLPRAQHRMAPSHAPHAATHHKRGDATLPDLRSARLPIARYQRLTACRTTPPAEVLRIQSRACALRSSGLRPLPHAHAPSPTMRVGLCARACIASWLRACWCGPCVVFALLQLVQKRLRVALACRFDLPEALRRGGATQEVRWR